MGNNPSTVWTQLSSPASPAGSIPFVDDDEITIITDVTNFYWNATDLVLKVANGLKTKYSDTTATPGDVTIDKSAGRVRLGAGFASLIVTNSLVTATSIVQVQLETADATCTRVIVTPAAGSFTITGNAVATGNVNMTFTVQQVY